MNFLKNLNSQEKLKLANVYRFRKTLLLRKSILGFVTNYFKLCFIKSAKRIYWSRCVSPTDLVSRDFWRQIAILKLKKDMFLTLKSFRNRFESTTEARHYVNVRPLRLSTNHYNLHLFYWIFWSLNCNLNKLCNKYFNTAIMFYNYSAII